MTIVTKIIAYCNINKLVDQMEKLTIKSAIEIAIKLVIILSFLPITIYLCRIAMTI